MFGTSRFDVPVASNHASSKAKPEFAKPEFAKSEFGEFR
jgi:hypothetical protein